MRVQVELVLVGVEQELVPEEPHLAQQHLGWECESERKHREHSEGKDHNYNCRVASTRIASECGLPDEARANVPYKSQV